MWLMDTVGIRDLKNHLSEYVRRVRAGEKIRISSHGEVVAELRSPEPDRVEQAPAGLRELVRRGTARGIVRNEPSRYRTYEPVLTRTTAKELLDLDRGDR
jgi:prevent-host-death family protein